MAQDAGLKRKATIKLQRAGVRLRGHHTLGQLRRLGLRAPQDVHMAGRCYVDPRWAWAISIGSATIISSDVRIIAHDAAMRRLIGYTEVRPVTIGENCYIGIGAIILPGTTIGDGSIIGAASVVRGDIPAGVVAAGNPARQLQTVGEYGERRTADLARSPRHEVRGREVDAALRAQLIEELEEHGRLFVR